MSQAEILLGEVKLLKEQYTQRNKKETREFNIFSSLCNAKDEVNFHSKFISDLLNPKGTHGQGSLFLKLFFEELDFIPLFSHYFLFQGKYNADILIKSLSHVFIIENKISPQTHSRSLMDCWKRMKDQGYYDSNIEIIYLTLFEEKTIETNFPSKIRNISYEKEICHWLNCCMKKLKSSSLLYTTLLEYRSVIEELIVQIKRK